MHIVHMASYGVRPCIIAFQSYGVKPWVIAWHGIIWGQALGYCMASYGVKPWFIAFLTLKRTGFLIKTQQCNA
jgi:hypothetical protein